MIVGSIHGLPTIRRNIYKLFNLITALFSMMGKVLISMDIYIHRMNCHSTN